MAVLWQYPRKHIVITMELDMRLQYLAQELGADFYGVADLAGAHDEILRQGGEDVASYPRAISFGITLFDSIVDELPRRREERAVTVNYLHHCYDVINARLDYIASRLGGLLQGAGYRTLPLPSSERFDSVRICAQFSHKLAASQAGLGWIGKSCLLVTPEAGPRVRWNSVLTFAPLEPTGTPMEQRCGECNECVEICPQHAFIGRRFSEDEPREARYDAAACERYFTEADESEGRVACGMCIYICPWGRKA
ncbi:MAG: 4Fe-4S double cluster binding domain-containing protein [Candidatus Geothermincolia bacterium]